MKFFILTCKRLFRRPAFLLLLLSAAAAIFFAPLLGRDEAIPPAGVCDLDGSAASAAVCEMLCADGFVLCDDEAELRAGVQSGRYDCGVILPCGMEDALRKGRTEGMLPLITAPTSFVPELYQNHVTAAVFSVYAPYLTADVLADTPISEEEVLEEYRTLMESGLLFSFTLSTGEEAIQPENTRALTYTLGAASLFLFALLVYATCGALTGDCARFARRIGLGRTLRFILLPELVLRAALAMLFSAAALCLASFITEAPFLLRLIWPICVYILLLSSLSMVISAVFSHVGQMQTLSCFLLLLALVLCPIYTDVTLTFPFAAVLRCFVPSYWLWLAYAHPLPCSVVAIALLPITYALLYLLRRLRLPVSEDGE